MLSGEVDHAAEVQSRDARSTPAASSSDDSTGPTTLDARLGDASAAELEQRVRAPVGQRTFAIVPADVCQAAAQRDACGTIQIKLGDDLKTGPVRRCRRSARSMTRRYSPGDLRRVRRRRAAGGGVETWPA